jgi:hypothetical protein
MDMIKGLVLASIIAASVATSAASAPADEKNRKVLIENNSGQSLDHLYASPVTSTTWEEDLLGDKTFPTGTKKSANIDNGTVECFYDLKLVGANGKEYVRRNVNVCATAKWVISDSADTLQ